MTSPTPLPLRWEAVLDRLESDLAEVEALLVSGAVVEPTSWEPPPLTTDLPPALRPRALALAARQEQVAHDVAVAMARTRDLVQRATREQALAHHVQAATARSHPPVYLDITT